MKAPHGQTKHLIIWVSLFQLTLRICDSAMTMVFWDTLYVYNFNHFLIAVPTPPSVFIITTIFLGYFAPVIFSHWSAAITCRSLNTIIDTWLVIYYLQCCWLHNQYIIQYIFFTFGHPFAYRIGSVQSNLIFGPNYPRFFRYVSDKL